MTEIQAQLEIQKKSFVEKEKELQQQSLQNTELKQEKQNIEDKFKNRIDFLEDESHQTKQKLDLMHTNYNGLQKEKNDLLYENESLQKELERSRYNTKKMMSNINNEFKEV